MKKVFWALIFVIGLLITINGALAAIPTTNLLYGYNFEQQNNTLLLDVKGTLNLTPNGNPQNVSGKIGSGKNFTGASGNYYSIGSYSSKLNNAYGVTMCVWFKKNVNSAWAMVWQDEITPNNNGYYVAVDESSNKYFFSKHSGASGYTFSSTGTSTANVWTHMCMVDTGSQFKLYVNGNNTENASSSIAIAEATRQLFVGRRSDNFGINGVLDEMYVWNGSLTDSQIQELYQNGNNGISYPWAQGSPINITWLSQTPADITSTNLITQHLNISYSVNLTNVTDILINYTINGSKICYIFDNQKCNMTNNTYKTEIQTHITSPTQIYFEFEENQVYPGSFYYAEDFFEKTTHIKNNLTSQNEIIKYKVLNMSTNTYYNIFEAMINNSNTNTIYYCNASYDTGNIITNPFCGVINSFTYTNFNHTHNENSTHNIFIFNINTTGHINNLGIKATETSYFIVRGSNIGITNYYTAGININNATQYSGNLGTTYINNSLMLDAHIHQYNPNWQFKYIAGLNKSGVYEWENLTGHIDNYDLAILPPTQPNFINPDPNAEYTNLTERYFNITYTGSSNITGYLLFYNISLLNEVGAFVKTIISNNSLNLYYNWNMLKDNINPGIYYLKIEIKDSNNLTNSQISKAINISVDKELNITLRSIIGNSTINNFTANITDIDINLNNIINTTNGLIQKGILSNHNIKVDIINAPGYAIFTNNETLNATKTNIYYNDTQITFYLWPYNSINFSFYDVASPNNLLIINSIFLNLISGTYSQNYTITNGYQFVENLTYGDWQANFEAPGYSENNYFFTIFNGSTQKIKLYLTNDSGTSLYKINVKDQNDDAIPNVIVRLQRQDFNNISQYVTLQECQANDLGTCFMYIEESITIQYRFIIIQSGIAIHTTNPSQIIELPDSQKIITIRIKSGQNLVDPAEQYLNLYTKIIPPNAYNITTFNFIDGYNAITGGCLRTSARISQSVPFTLINEDCVAGTTGIITFNQSYYANNSYELFYEGIINYTGYNLQRETLITNYITRGTNQTAEDDLLFTLIVFITISFLTIWITNIYLQIIINFGVVIGTYLLSLNKLGLPLIMGFLVLGIYINWDRQRTRGRL